MKKLVGALAIAVAMLLPGAAFAGSSTDAALGLGAFAVFNQILGGVGIFGRPAPVVYAPAPVVYAPPPVYVAPPAVVYAPAPPVVVYAPAPPVFVRPAPVFVRPVPRPVVVHGNPHWGNSHWQRAQWGHRGW